MVAGGAGSAVAEALAAQGLAVPVLMLGPARCLRRARRSRSSCSPIAASTRRASPVPCASASRRAERAPERPPDDARRPHHRGLRRGAGRLRRARRGRQAVHARPDVGHAQKAIDRVVTWPQLEQGLARLSPLRHAATVADQFTDALLRLVVDWKDVDQLAARRWARTREYTRFHPRAPEEPRGEGRPPHGLLAREEGLPADAQGVLRRGRGRDEGDRRAARPRRPAPRPLQPIGSGAAKPPPKRAQGEVAPAMRLKDKVALVTGAAQGIGLACAQALRRARALRSCSPT